MDNPLVSIVCLCYNHEEFVIESLNSIFNQTYGNVEVIIIDDFSTDNSRDKIEHRLINQPGVRYIKNDSNIGNCKSFNIGLKEAKGKYILDFATDDFALKNRIEKQVSFFEQQSEQTGLIYSNGRYLYEDAAKNYIHFSSYTKWNVYTGNVYIDVLREYFIHPSTVMFRTSALRNVGGYDESLSYEDFDIWVRLSRKYELQYLNEILTEINKYDSSMSTRWYKKGDSQIHCTYLICKKAQALNNNDLENDALITRVKYEIRMCFLNGLNKDLENFYSLLRELNGNNPKYWFWHKVGKLRIRFTES